MPKKSAAKKSPEKPASSKKPAAKKKAGPPIFPSTGFWLMKSEPESYPIERFEADGKTLWTGVRNYQARNFMMHSMKPGDKFLFYHSNADPAAVVGVGEVVKPNVADPSALDPENHNYDAKASFDHPIWFCAEVAFKQKLTTPVSLADIRANKNLQGMALLAPGQRLSIQPVSAKDFALILKLGST